MRRVPLTVRAQPDAASSDAVDVVLVHITHPDMPGVLRLSSDPTERLGVTPLIYGTRSRWMTGDGAPFLFLMMAAMLPSDEEDAPPAASLVFDAASADMANALRSTLLRADVAMAVVSAADPHAVQAEWQGLSLVSAEGGAAEITLTLSRDPLTAEPWPSGRMTKERFPGLHR